MTGEKPKSRVIFLLLGSSILIAVTLDLVLGQNVTTDEGSVMEKFEAIIQYTINLSIDPSRIQVIADPRLSSEFYPMYELVYMSNNPSGQIRRIPEVSNKISDPKVWQSQTDIVADFTTIANPNKMGILPRGTVEKQPSYVWWVASGFFDVRSAFTSNFGGIFLINMAADRWMPIPIVRRTGKAFTHVEWLDMNLDGYVDCVTIEGSTSMNSLMWLQQPSNQAPWKQIRISGIQEDVGGTEFRLVTLPSSVTNAMTNIFIVAGRTTGKLTAYWVEDVNNNWTRQKKIRKLEIASDGSYVGLEIVDLNLDGRLDILTTTTATAKRRGMVLAYEYPKDGFDSGGKWKTHILSQWNTTATSFLTTSPGPAFSFTLQTGIAGRRQQKPHILVSGQDDGKVYILSPETWSPYMWKYKRQEIWTSTKKVGIPAVADVDGNGVMDIFIPSDFSINVLKIGNNTTTPVETAKSNLTSTTLPPSTTAAITKNAGLRCYDCIFCSTVNDSTSTTSCVGNQSIAGVTLPKKCTTIVTYEGPFKGVIRQCTVNAVDGCMDINYGGFKAHICSCTTDLCNDNAFDNFSTPSPQATAAIDYEIQCYNCTDCPKVLPNTLTTSCEGTRFIAGMEVPLKCATFDVVEGPYTGVIRQCSPNVVNGCMDVDFQGYKANVCYCTTDRCNGDQLGLSSTSLPYQTSTSVSRSNASATLTDKGHLYKTAANNESTTFHTTQLLNRTTSTIYVVKDQTTVPNEAQANNSTNVRQETQQRNKTSTNKPVSIKNVQTIESNEVTKTNDTKKGSKHESTTLQFTGTNLPNDTSARRPGPVGNGQSNENDGGDPGNGACNAKETMPFFVPLLIIVKMWME